MKASVFFAAALLCLLALACRQTPEVVTPVVLPPSTVTPIPVTDVASLTGVVPPALTVAGCRIVKTVYKTNGAYQRADTDVERIIIDGWSYYVGNGMTTQYEYDNQGRISRITRGAAPSGVTTYQYKPGLLSIETDGDGAALRRETVILNEHGYRKYEIPGLERLYDQTGYLVGLSGPGADSYIQTEAGNVRRLGSSYAPGDGTYRYVSTYRYDLTRPGLPNPKQYLGRDYPGPNLAVNETYAELSSGAVFNDARYFYQYDRQGRISRRIERGVPNLAATYVTAGLITAYTAVTDYEYECP